MEFLFGFKSEDFILDGINNFLELNGKLKNFD
jgi:hypothetical protein